MKPQPVSTAENIVTQMDAKNTTLSEEALMKDICEENKQKPLPCAEIVIKEPQKTQNLSEDYKRCLKYGSLTTITIKACEKALKHIQNASIFSESFDPKILFQIAEKLLSFQSWILGEMMMYESLYRNKMAELRREDMSAAAAEIEAKNSNDYRAYRFLKYIYELAGEQQLMVKKFSDKLQQEFNNSNG